VKSGEGVIAVFVVNRFAPHHDPDEARGHKNADSTDG
jgi:hypothetical protein